LSLSFLVFRQISVRLERKHFDPVYDRLDELQLETASRILNSDGQKALANYLTGLDRISGAHHYLLDANGIDLASLNHFARLSETRTKTSSIYSSGSAGLRFSLWNSSSRRRGIVDSGAVTRVVANTALESNSPPAI
jgi:hypothetical protein